jgi:uridine phosphorylase
VARLHHLEIDAARLAGNGGLGRYVFVPGSVDRAARIAKHFERVEVVENRRRLDVFLGQLPSPRGPIDVAAIPTGMGCPSLDIVVGELLEAGVRRFLRVGTAGALQPEVRIGDAVIASGAVRDESASDTYVPRDVPAMADPLWVEALARAATELGIAGRAHVGLVHSKDSFFGREFGRGPDGERNHAYMAHLARAGVLASEMEAAHLFVLGQVFGGAPRDVARWRTHAARVRCGALCAVVGDPEHGFASRDEEIAAEERLIELAVRGVVALSGIEGVAASA